MQKYFARQQQWHQSFLSKTNNQQFETFKNGQIILSWEPSQTFSYSMEFQILVAIQHGMAYVYHFNENGWEQLQTISSPKSNHQAISLYYMNQCNSLVIGDYDGNVTIWKFKEDSRKFQIQYFLDDQKNRNKVITQILKMNRAETLLIQSKVIGVNFWLKKDNTWNLNQWQQFSFNTIESLELSPDEKTIIMFDDMGRIIVSQQNENQKWMKKQLIYFESDRISWNISFCNIDIFGLLPQKTNPKILVFFQLNQTNGLYEIIESYSLRSQNYGQQQLNVKKNKQQVPNRDRNQLNIENKEFGMIKSIIFRRFCGCGSVIDNGRKIILFNVSTQQLLFWQQPND